MVHLMLSKGFVQQSRDRAMHCQPLAMQNLGCDDVMVREYVLSRSGLNVNYFSTLQQRHSLNDIEVGCPQQQSAILAV